MSFNIIGSIILITGVSYLAFNFLFAFTLVYDNQFEPSIFLFKDVTIGFNEITETLNSLDQELSASGLSTQNYSIMLNHNSDSVNLEKQHLRVGAFLPLNKHQAAKQFIANHKRYKIDSIPRLSTISSDNISLEKWYSPLYTKVLVYPKLSNHAKTNMLKVSSPFMLMTFTKSSADEQYQMKLHLMHERHVRKLVE